MDLLATPRRRRFLFAALYLSEGAPIGYVWWALPTRLRAAGVPIDEITLFTGLLVLPWSFKFLWAPAVDVLRTQRFTLRSWIVAAQAAMGVTLLPLAFLDLRADFGAVFVLLLAHAVAAATQDVAIDALAIAEVDEAERGALNGWMQAGVLCGRALFGGAALAVERVVGQQVVIVALIAVTWSSLALVLMARERRAPAEARGFRSFAKTLAAAARGRPFRAGLGFALVGGAGFEAAGSLMGPLLVDRGLPQDRIAWLFGVAAPVGMTAGALAGGYLSDRLGRRRTTAVFLVVAACVVALGALDPVGSSQRLILAATALYLSIGLFTAGSYALFMQITEPRLGATQFSAYMGATNGCESWSGIAAGQAARAFGYPAALALLSGVSLLALPLLALLPAERPPRRSDA